MRGKPRLPPENFAIRTLPLVPAAGAFYRCANANRPLLDWDHRETSRFSHPSFRFPVLYLAVEKLTSFWECFGDELNDQAPGQRALSRAQLGSREWVSFNIVPHVLVVDTTDARVLRTLGADASTFFAEYTVTQAWAKALMEHPARPDGLYYRSRLHATRKCLAVFGKPGFRRATSRFNPVKTGPLLEDRDFLLFLAIEDVDLLP